VKKLVALSVLGVSLFSASAAMAQTFKGVVSDAMCASDVSKASKPDHAACAKKCIGMGSPAVLIVGTTVYKVSNPEKLSAYGGKTVLVDGKLEGGVITVASVKD
jgi:hypothetical protein